MFARDAEVEKIFRLVMEGTSVEMIGARWSGRTEVLNRVAELFASLGRDIVVVRGVGSRLPLEAVRVAMSGHRAGGSGQNPPSPTVLIGQFSALRPAVILIDDGDQLDDASWVVIETVHKMLGIPVVCAALTRPILSHLDHVLIKIAHPVVRVLLDELPVDVIHELLEDRLEGTVTPSLSGRIHTMAAGIPGFALAIADAALADGLIRRQDALWIDGPDLWSPDLAGAYEALLYTYGVAVREALEKIALAGTVDLLTARALIGQALIEELEQHALVKVFMTRDRTLLAVNPPGIGDYFRHQPLTAHRIRIVESITEVLGEATGSSLDSVHLYLQRLPESGRTPLGDLPLVSRMFTESFRAESAAALHEWTATKSVAAAVHVLTLQLTGPRDPEVVTQVLEDTALAGAAPQDELTFRYLHSRWILTEGGTIEDALAPLSGSRPLGEIDSALAIMSYAIEMEHTGIPADYEAVLTPASTAADFSGDMARLLLAYGHLLSARGEDALRLLEPRHRKTEPILGRHYDIAYGLALYSCGRLGDAADWATEHVAIAIASLDRMPLAGHSYVAVLSLAALGRFDEAVDISRVVLTARVGGGTAVFASDRAMMFALAAVAMRMGRNTAAEGLLLRAESLPAYSDALPLGHAGFVAAAAASADGDRQKAAALYNAVATTLASRGYRLAADGATMLSLITHFDPERARDFRSRAETIGGPLYGAYLDGRDASLREDADDLARAGRVLRDHQAGDEALRFLTQAVTIYRDRGAEATADEIRAEVKALLDDPSAESTRARSAVQSFLTERELEIVRCVAADLSNTEIATRLGIGDRTVETHLRNIRKKTGVVRREDLAALANG